MIDLNNIVNRLLLEESEIECIVYRNEDIGAGGRRFRHIDVEMTYGEYIELIESDLLYQEIYEQCRLADAYNEQEVVLFQKQEG